MTLCKENGCAKLSRAQGYCDTHYRRAVYRGEITTTKPENPHDRFKKWFKFPDDTGCWEWAGHKDKDGYGKFRLNGKKMSASSAAYRLFRGEIPEGVLVCHECDNPSCVNPEHLFLGTHKDNKQDSVSKNRHHKERDKNGKYTSRNIDNNAQATA